MPVQHDSLASRRAFVAGAATAAVAAISPRGARSQTPAALRVITGPSDFAALPFYAQDNGSFTRAGLAVELSTMGSGIAAMTAVAGGSVEISVASSGSVAASVANGLPFTIIADAGLYDAKHPVNLLCVAPDSPIKTPKDLAGKKIAVNGLKNLGQAAVEAWLDKNGVDPASVGFVEMGFAAMGPLVASGRLDAAFITEPILSTVRSTLRVIGAPYDAVSPQFSITCYAARPDWVAKNHDVAARFARVMRQTAEWANANPQLSAPILAKYSKLPDAVIAHMTRTRYATSLELSNLQPGIDVMAKYGYISKRVDAETCITRL